MRAAWWAAGAAAWLVTRAWVVWLLLDRFAWVNGDVGYFALSLGAAPGNGLAHTLTEYPLPAVGVLAVPVWLAHLTSLSYQTGMVAVVLFTDLAFTLALALLGPARRRAGVVLWLLAVPALGPVALARFDLLPGVLAGVLLLLLGIRPTWSAAVAGVATGVKLWPVLLVPPLLAFVRRRGAGLAAVVGVGVVLAGATVLLAGWPRLFSPLRYQFGRGLEIEAVVATPALLRWWAEPDVVRIGYAPSRSYEFSGPGVGVLMAVSSVLVAAYALVLLVGWTRAWSLRDRLSPSSVVWLALFAVGGFVATGKVLSPQYFLWLLPVAAAGLAIGAEGRRLVGWSALLLVTSVLTQLEFPVWFGGLTLRMPPVGPAVLALAVRNLTMVVLVVWSAVEAHRSLRRDAATTAVGARTEARSSSAGVGSSP